MGKAVVKCFAKNDYSIHAWNRGERNRQVIKDLHLPNVEVYDQFYKAVEQSDIVFMHIDAGTNLANTNTLIRSTSESSSWKDKILIQFSSIRQNKYMSSLDGTLVSGAFIAVPETICSDAAMILVSASEHSTLKTVNSTLSHLGSVVHFDNDIGLAALANMAIIQALTFGLAGHEMAHLLMEQYGAPLEFIEQCAQVIMSVVPSYAKMLYGIVSKSITSKQWSQSYVPSQDMLNLLEMHARFLREMNVKGDTYLEGYMKYLRKISNSTHGPSAWIQHALAAKTGEEL
eukprot:CAMPEP_0178929566 /NCGR_PEP_ID=MMETSP0786-20121207/20679_1 /TAXON_ID=186022 /ORGANISM="Thalassionema frauenfeldii, Strain CCMP 1798" /LENGTH=286 /DNA_ID=CAMNT_0020605853 /DNA_START=137 /DNA_END=997 /DNA_ORIENTATION=-